MEGAFTNNKKINPQEKSNFVSNLFYTWTLPIFVKGYHTDLTEDDLYKTLEKHNSNKLGNKLEKYWTEQLKEKTPSLVKALWKAFWTEICLNVLIYFVCCFAGRMIQPLLLMRVLDYYVPSQSDITSTEAYLSAAGIILTTFINSIGGHTYVMGMQQLGMKIRVAICSLIYRKTLKLNKQVMGETSTGQIVTLLSNDVRLFDYVMLEFCLLISAPSELISVIFLLYYLLGPTAIAGIGFMLLSIPLQLFSSKLTASFRFRIAQKTDLRISLMNEIISGIKVIKMYAWEKPFSNLVKTARRLEIKQVRGISYLHSLIFSYGMFMNRMSIFICITCYVLSGNTPVARYVFVITSFYNILAKTVSVNFPSAISTFAESKVSCQRIVDFLLLEEIKPDEQKYCTRSDKTVLILDKINAKWDPLAPQNFLRNITIRANVNETIAIIGPVGSGKSSLLQVILGELTPTSGDLKISGTVSYACQEPWLFKGSIRQNILFGNTFNAKKYNKVINVCALQRDFSMFPHADLSIVGEKGVMLSGGQKARINLARAIYKDADIYILDDPLSAVDAQVGKQLFDQCINGYLAQKCVVLVTHQLQYLRHVDCIYVLENGEVKAFGSYDDIQAYNTDFAKGLNLNTDAMEAELVSSDVEETLVEEKEAPSEMAEDLPTGSMSKNVYATYFKSGGPCCFYGSIFILFIVTQSSASFADYFVTFWVNWEQTKKNYNVTSNGTEYLTTLSWTSKYFTTNNCIYFYTALISFIICVTLIRSMSFYQYCCNISAKLHNNMFSALVKAPARFYDVNPSGRILNRFSKDIGVIDERLTFSLFDTIEVGVFLTAVTTVLSTINPYILIPTFVLILLFYGYKHYYIRTSRSIKRIEGITRSPVFSHIAASIQGLSTIRALKAQQILIEEFDRHQDNHTSAYYLFLGCNRAFGMLLDLNCITYMGVVTLTTIFTTHFGGNVGLAITQAISLTGRLQWGMRQWSELQNLMTSVERVLEYTEIEAEADHVATPPESWPQTGEIQFKSVFLRYSPSDPYILQNLSFKITAKSKIGVVGRTGAGKSSLITALFKLAPLEGQILIDGVNICEISSESLRTKISIIPQEPFLFSGTLRKNLDPFDQFEDKLLWDALCEVELKKLITESPFGLNYPVSEGGSNFSVGQRQLVCLARAITRSNKILVLDEATANVDPATDELIQSTIRRKFRECTVLTIAHRLHTIMDSDKVLVMDAGTVVEFGHPKCLLENEQGYFFNLVRQAR